MKTVLFLGSIGVGVLLILALFPGVVNAQTINLNERQINIFQQIKEKIKNNELKLSSILNIKLLKDVTKESGWFPGIFFVLLFNLIYNSIGLFLLFLDMFVF